MNEHVMKDIVKLSCKIIAKPEFQRKIREAAKETAVAVLEHSGEIIENIGHFFGA